MDGFGSKGGVIGVQERTRFELGVSEKGQRPLRIERMKILGKKGKKEGSRSEGENGKKAIAR